MIIEAHDIHKSFGQLEVLKGIDFSADKAETVSIMGASGTGKSTLLQILGTLSTPDSGSLMIDGEDVLKLRSEQQRTAIARAIINRPSVLFADEPTGNLDSATKQEIHKVFFDLRDSIGQTIVIVTHDPQLASLCDRRLEMKDGLFV